MLSAIVSALHCSVAPGLPAVFLRGRALRAPLDATGLRRLFAAVVLLEVWPMLTFIRWRAQQRLGQHPDTSRARQLYAVNHMVFVPAFMARGFGAR